MRTRPSPRAVRDDVDYGHRHFINLLSAVFLLLLAVAMTWAVKALDEQESMRKCFASGRKDCVTIIGPPKDMRQAVR
ncbi:MAG: hypothetical protein Q8M31_13645 [Beijerinckiaceae bacterium]|nr:hypothetical protein [Beijerinckiaceae bacterium]